jgi:hypothetical protein
VDGGHVKIAIGGIKFSEELAHFLYHTEDGVSGPALDEVMANLAQGRLNLPFLVVNGAESGGGEAVFCVAEADFPAADMILRRLSLIPREDLGGRADNGVATVLVRRRVGTLTIFPHRRSYDLLGRVVATLAAAGIVVHSFCTSISALAVNIDHRLLVKAVEALEGLLQLPENHAPFHPEFCIRQTAPR